MNIKQFKLPDVRLGKNLKAKPQVNPEKAANEGAQAPQEDVQISKAARSSSSKKKFKLGPTLLRGLGYAVGATAAVVGGVSGAVGAAVGAVVGAGVGAVVNGVRNFDIYNPGKMDLATGARRGAAVGAAVGGVLGATTGYTAIAVSGGAGALVVGAAAAGTIALVEGYKG